MATLKVSGQAQLLSALKTAKGGDTILLADGNYGDIDIKNDYGSTVTLKAVNPLGAEFTGLGLVGATNITLNGLQCKTGLAVTDGSKDIAVLNSDIDGNFYTRSVNGLTVDNVDVSGGRWGLLLNSVQNFKITNSYIHDVTEDLMRITGNSYNGVVENNVISDTNAKKPLHPDIIQFFHANGVAPRDITIRGNVLSDSPDPGMVPAQGIFLSDPGRGNQNKGYSNILIEDNLINTAATNTVFVNSGKSSVQILNNTLISRDGGGGNIRLIGKTFDDKGPVIDGNVFKALINDVDAVTLGDNFIYGKSVDVKSLFTGTNGADWKSYIPVKGSAIDFGKGYGATDRLAELLGGGGGGGQNAPTLPRDSAPVPPPTPPAVPAQDDDADLVYSSAKTFEISGSKTWAALKHDKKMAIDEGSIGLTFNADTVAGTRGIISKGAAGNRDDFSAWIKNGKLIVCFENGQEKVTITKTGIKADRDYDLLITFDEDVVQVWLNDGLVGQASIDLDLSQNKEALVIGAMNGASTRGTTNKVGSFFDGTITDLKIHDEAMTPAELAALDDVGHARAMAEQASVPAFHQDVFA